MVRCTHNLQHFSGLLHYRSQPPEGNNPHLHLRASCSPHPDSAPGEQRRHGRHVCGGLKARLTEQQEVSNRSILLAHLRCILSLRRSESLPVYPGRNGGRVTNKRSGTGSRWQHPANWFRPGWSRPGSLLCGAPGTGFHPLVSSLAGPHWAPPAASHPRQRESPPEKRGATGA